MHLSTAKLNIEVLIQFVIFLDLFGELVVELVPCTLRLGISLDETSGLYVVKEGEFKCLKTKGQVRL